MTQLRVHELAKECGVPARTILEFLSRIGMFAKWASSRLDPRQVQAVRTHLATTEADIQSLGRHRLHPSDAESATTPLPSHNDARTSRPRGSALAPPWTPAEPLGSVGSYGGQQLRMGTVRLQHGSVGHTFETLLVPYLVEAQRIEIVDRWIRYRHQVENLADLLAAVAVARSRELPTLEANLTTTRAPDPKDHANQERWLAELQPEPGPTIPLRFSHKYSDDSSDADDIHDRTITTSDGWYILLGRGLDIFQPMPGTTSLNVRRRTQVFRPVRGTHITYNRID